MIGERWMALLEGVATLFIAVTALARRHLLDARDQGVCCGRMTGASSAARVRVKSSTHHHPPVSFGILQCRRYHLTFIPLRPYHRA